MAEQAKTITVTCPKCGEEINVTNIERKIQEKKQIKEEIEEHIARLTQEIEWVRNEITKTEKEIDEIQKVNSDLKQEINKSSDGENNMSIRLKIISNQDRLPALESERSRLKNMLKAIGEEKFILDFQLKELEEQRKEN